MLNKYYLGTALSVILAGSFFPASAQTPMSGIYTIGGSSPNYATFNAAVSALKTNGISGAVTFNVRKGTYSERISIPEITGSSAVNIITFQAETGLATDVTITSIGGGTHANHHTIQLNGVDYVTLNKLTIANTAPANASGVHLFKGAEYNKITNCIIKVDTSNSSDLVAGIIASDSAACPNSMVVPGHHASHLEISNNLIIGGSTGIALIGDYSYNLPHMTGIVIKNNTLNYNIKYGIFIEYGVDSLTIQDNKLNLSAVANTAYGMYIYEVNNFNISGNYLKHTGQHGFYIYYCNNGLVANNMLAGGYTRSNTIGYCLYLYGCNDVKFYYNSAVYDALSGTTTGIISAVVYIDYCTKLGFLNNNFVNSGSGYVYYIYAAGNISESDYNNLYTTGTILAYYNGADKATLDDFQKATKKDAHSISVNPGYVANLNLHISSVLLNGKASPIQGIDKDFDGEIRHTKYPDIGCDEFIPFNFDIGIIDLGPHQADKGVSTTLQAVLTNDGSKPLKDSLVSLSYSTDGGNTWSAPEQYKIQGLTSTYSTEVYSFQATWTRDQLGSNAVCMRINPPGLLTDINKDNDTYCDSICVGLNTSTFTIGSNQADFPTIKAALDVLKASRCGIKGPVVFKLQDGIYNERISLPEIKGTSETNTITFEAQSGNPEAVIISSNGGNNPDDHHVVKLNGTSYARFNNLTIKNMATQFASGFNICNADHNTISHCIIKLDSNKAEGMQIGILISDPEIIDNGGVGMDNLFTDNRIEGGSFGIQLLGQPTNYSKGNRVNNNTILSCNTSGIYLDNNNANLNNNRIIMRKGNDQGAGISVNNYYGSFNINANYVYGAGRSGINATNLWSEKAGIIANNMIAGGFNNPEDGYGIYISNATKTKVYYNSSVYDKPGMSNSYAFYNESGDSMEVKNNIFINSGGGYAYFVNNSEAILASDYNDLYTTGSRLAFWNDDQNTLAGLQNESGMDKKSISAKPTFSSLSDLHTFDFVLDAKGVHVPAVTTDFDGQPRDKSKPDIGADEFTVGQDGGVVQWINPSVGSPLDSVEVMKVKLSNIGNTPLSNFNVSYTIDGVEQSTESYTGSIAVGGSDIYAFSKPWNVPGDGKYKLCAKTIISGDVNSANDEKCMEVNLSVGVDGVLDEKELLQIYPNPTDKKLYVASGGSRSGMVRAFNLVGQLVYEHPLSDESATKLLMIDTSLWPAGMYCLIVTGNQGSMVEKLLIRH